RAVAAEFVPLYVPRPALAAAERSDVDSLSGHEYVDFDLVADGETVDVVDAQFDEPHTRLHTRLGEVTRLGLGELLGGALAVGHLHRGVAVALGCLHLDDACRQ